MVFIIQEEEGKDEGPDDKQDGEGEEDDQKKPPADDKEGPERNPTVSKYIY